VSPIREQRKEMAMFFAFADVHQFDNMDLKVKMDGVPSLTWEDCSRKTIRYMCNYPSVPPLFHCAR